MDDDIVKMKCRLEVFVFAAFGGAFIGAELASESGSLGYFIGPLFLLGAAVIAVVGDSTQTGDDDAT